MQLIIKQQMGKKMIRLSDLQISKYVQILCTHNCQFDTC